MYIPPNKKSRFWSETQKSQNKISPQEAVLDSQNNDLKGATENFTLKPSQKPVPESIRNALFGLTSNVDNQKVAPAPIWDHIDRNRSQSIDASPSNENPSKPELPKESLSSPSSPKEDFKANLKKGPSFKSYRDKFSIRVIPPRSIGPATIVPIHAESIDVAIDSEKDTGASGALITPTSLLKNFNFENPDNREDVETRKFRLKRSLRRSLDAIYFLGNLIALTNHIKVRGSIRPVTYLQKQKTKKIIEERKRFCLPLMPTDTFKVFWNIILVVLYAASAILTPFTVSFIEDGNTVFENINTVFNVLFGIDIAINFISAFYSSKIGLVTDLKAIALNYLKTWFLLDLLLVLPIDSFFQEFASGNGSSANRIKSLLRLLRIPRIYRILRVLRLFKMAKLFITSKTLNRMLKQFTLNIGLIKMVQVLGNLLFLNHIAACIWFLFARLSNFTPETWVVRSDLVDADPWTQYIASYYWAFQTLTTVGYGDINPETGYERALAIIWMIVGVCMYSFAIANLSSILQNMDRRSAVLRNKITAFNNFSIKVKLPDFLRQKVQRFFELNHKENIFYWIDPHDLLEDLPQNLRQSFLLYTYYPMINTIKLFKLDANFTVDIAPHLKLLKLKIFEILYREDDPSQEIYFISKGSVKFVTENGDGIFSLVQGTYFGEMEVLDDVKRRSFCKAMEPTALFVCNKKIFLQAMKKYPKVEEHIKKSVQLRKEKFLNKMKEYEIETQNQNKQQNDSISTVVGRKLLKSSDYFYAIVNQSNNRNKRFSSLSVRDPGALEEFLTKRPSESVPVTPKTGGPKSKIMDLIRNMDKDKLEKTDRDREKDDKTNKSSTATNKFESWTAAIIHHRSKSHKLLFQSDNQLSLAKKDNKSLIPLESQQRLSNIIIQNKKAAAENDAQSFDTSFQSSVFSQSPKAATDAKDDDKRSAPPLKLFGQIHNFDQCEQKRPSQNSNSLESQGNHTSNEKCDLINSLDKKYEQMYNIRDEIDHLFNTYEQKKEDVDRNFESIEQSQRELDEFAEKLFKFTKQ